MSIRFIHEERWTATMLDVRPSRMYMSLCVGEGSGKANICHHSCIYTPENRYYSQILNRPPLLKRIICLLLAQILPIVDRIMCMFDQFISKETDQQHWFIWRKTSRKMQGCTPLVCSFFFTKDLLYWINFDNYCYSCFINPHVTLHDV